MSFWWEDHDERPAHRSNKADKPSEGLQRAVRERLERTPDTDARLEQLVRINPKRADEDALEYAARLARLGGLS